MSQPERPPRPVLRADLTALGGWSDPTVTTRAELAAATAAALVAAGRSGIDQPAGAAAAGAADTERLVGLVDEVGLDTLAELWREAEPSSLAGSLWAVYLLRTWTRTDPAELTRLWRAGRALCPADEVVAGVADDAGASELAEMADAVLHGAYRGDFAVALERAAACFRVIAAGRRDLAAEGESGEVERARAERNERAADGLAWAAVHWRTDSLR